MEGKLCILVIIAGLINCSVAYYTYKYLDDDTVCNGNTVYLSSYSDGVKISSWDSLSSYKTPASTNCDITIASYGSNGLKFKFSSGSSISATDVKVKIYDGSSSYDSILDSYTWTDTLHTYYTYTSSEYITVRLYNPSRSTNFDFTLQVSNYGDSSSDSYSYSSTSYLSSWATGQIIGGVVGTVLFIVLLIVVSVSLSIRRRRILNSRVMVIRTGASVSQVTTSAQVTYPAPPPPHLSVPRAAYP